MVREYGDVGMVVYRFYQARLYLGSRIVGMVQDTKLGVSSFFMQIEFSAFFLIEINSPSDKRLDLAGASRTTFSTAARSLIQSPAIIVSSMCFSKLSTFKLVTEAIPPCAKYVLASSCPALQISATLLPSLATFRAKLIPAIPELSLSNRIFVPCFLLFRLTKLGIN